MPAGRSQPSLNLSHAVAVVLSQLFDVQQQRLLAEQQGQQQQEEEVAEARGGQPQEQLPAGGLQDSLERAGTGAGGSLLSGGLFESGEPKRLLSFLRCHADRLQLCSCPTVPSVAQPHAAVT